MEQEALIHYTVLREIDDAVAGSLATRHNLILVLRFSGDGIDPSDRNDISWHQQANCVLRSANGHHHAGAE